MDDKGKRIELSMKDSVGVDFITENSVSLHFRGSKKQDHGRVSIDLDKIDEFIDFLKELKEYHQE